MARGQIGHSEFQNRLHRDAFRGNLNLRIFLETRRSELMYSEYFKRGLNHGKPIVQESEGEHEKGSGHTLTWWCPSTAATVEMITVDGGGDLRRGRTGDDGDDPETRATAARGVGAKRLK